MGLQKVLRAITYIPAMQHYLLHFVLYKSIVVCQSWLWADLGFVSVHVCRLSCAQQNSKSIEPILICVGLLRVHAKLLTN